MTTKVDSRIEDYMKDLRAELRDFPATRRREILDEVQEHIYQARAELDAETEASVRTVLDRLGEPSDIAAEARDRFGIRPKKAGPLEVIAVVALLIPFFGWIVGTVLLWVSRVWSMRDKIIGTILVPGIWVFFFLSMVVDSVTVGTVVSGKGRGMGRALEPQAAETHWGGVLFVLAFFLIPIVTAIYLAIRARYLSQPDTAGTS